MSKFALILVFCGIYAIFCNDIQSNESLINQKINDKPQNKSLDVFEKEIEIIESTIDLYQRKVEILKKLRESYLVNERPIMVLQL